MADNHNHWTYRALGASNHHPELRANYDYYATDPSAIDGLFAAEKFGNKIWECASGENHLADKIEEIKTICQFCSKKSNHGTSNRKWKTSLRRQSDPNWRQRDLYPSLPQALFPTSDRGY